ncbi:MAG: hypothetical protein AAF804_16770, partial [Bacteroidota bacterium]
LLCFKGTSPFGKLFQCRSMLKNKWYRKGIPLLMLAILAYFPLFLHLDTNPVKAWDESLFALRAYSMAYYGKYLCAFDELPEAEPAPNTKPPLITWVQAGLFHLIGYGELALRLPIAFSALGILLTFLLLSWYHQRNYHWGMLASLVLLTTDGFIHEHMARTGDHDVPLAAFSLLILLGAYRFDASEGKDQRAIFLMAIAWLGGFLTKGSAALFFLPGIFVFFLAKKRLLPLMKHRATWWSLLGVSVALGAYLLYQEWSCPGFVLKMNRFEGVGHFVKARQGHQHPWDFYLKSWYEWKFTYWLPWLIPSAFLFWHAKYRAWRPVLGLIWACTISATLTISLSGTKLVWYDAVILPLLALLTGFSLLVLWESICQWLTLTDYLRQYLAGTVFFLVIGLVPYLAILDKVYFPQERMYVDERYPFLMEKLATYHPEEIDYAILQTYRGNHILFYRYLYNHHQGYQIRRYRDLAEVIQGDKLMICQPDINEYFRTWFEFEIVESYENCYLYRVGPQTQAGEQALAD